MINQSFSRMDVTLSTDIDVPVLQDVDLSNNFLSSIPTSLTGLPSLKRLSLSANLIQVR